MIALRLRLNNRRVLDPLNLGAEIARVSAGRDSLEALKAAGTTVERVMAVGGGSRSELWLRIIATALDVPVDVPAASRCVSVWSTWRRVGP